MLFHLSSLDKLDIEMENVDLAALFATWYSIKIDKNFYSQIFNDCHNFTLIIYISFEFHSQT